MAETGRKRQGELVRGVLEILVCHPDGLQVTEVLKELEATVPPTSFEASTYPNRPRVRRYEKIVRFSTIPTVKSGWLVKNKGLWSVTDEGRKALESFRDPEALMRESVRLYQAWKKTRPEPDEEAEAEEETVEAATTWEESEDSAWSEIRAYVGQMPPYDFQHLVAALLRAMGYYVLWDAPVGPDGGIDLIAHSDPLGTANPRIKVQVKRRADKIDADGLRSFMALLGDDDVGIFISVGGFKSTAEREARTQEKRRITLIDLNRLVSLWIEHYDKLPEEDRRCLPLRPIYFLAPAD
jgi:restriction system protein